jgi:hypothetical protein
MHVNFKGTVAGNYGTVVNNGMARQGATASARFYLKMRLVRVSRTEPPTKGPEPSVVFFSSFLM